MQLSSRIRQFYPEHYLPYNRKIIQWWCVSIERVVVIHTARNIACREEHLRWFSISDSCCVLFLMGCCVPLVVLKLCFVLGSSPLPNPSENTLEFSVATSACCCNVHLWEAAWFAGLVLSCSIALHAEWRWGKAGDAAPARGLAGRVGNVYITVQKSLFPQTCLRSLLLKFFKQSACGEPLPSA